MKIIAYATGEKGQGYVQKIGTFDMIEEIQIRVGMYDKDVVITFEEAREEE